MSCRSSKGRGQTKEDEKFKEVSNDNGAIMS